jgi:putative transposase
LIDLNRSALYYDPVIDPFDLMMMRLIDEVFTQWPTMGTRSMTDHLYRLGYHINRKRIQRYYDVMGIEAVFPKRNLSKAIKGHYKFPYLLKGVPIIRRDQVWSTDITYIPMARGYAYLTAIIDWYSRYILDWAISTSLEADFCIATLLRVLAQGRCDIFNTDQGAQYTTPLFTGPLLAHGIQVSMDGRGRALDNVFIERFWRSLKQELIYRREFVTVWELEAEIAKYIQHYNHERTHQGLAKQGFKRMTPFEVYSLSSGSGLQADFMP